MIAASLAFLLIGSGLGYLARPAPANLMRAKTFAISKARYMSLYSAETLLDMDSSPAILQRGLTRTAEDIGLALNPQQLALPGAELKMVRILRYEAHHHCADRLDSRGVWADGAVHLCGQPAKRDQDSRGTAARHEPRLVAR
jgi:hypothetical protein